METKAIKFLFKIVFLLALNKEIDYPDMEMLANPEYYFDLKENEE